MRLFAYGGTEYAERCRIGAWPAMATGPLDDTYGLSGDGVSFGCGLLENDPILIIRQAQKQGQRLYAYSLLLDSGPTVWERFQWNAASLVLALFGGVEPGESTPDCFGRQLLERPEEIDEGKLVSMFEGLPVPRISPARDSSDLLSIWVGAIYSSEPVTVAPQSIGMKSRPGIAEVASILQALPPCFRAGRGWLIGGSANHSQSFGAHLVLDDWLTQDAPSVQKHIRNGDQFRSAWETLAKDKSLGPLVHEILETPIWNWDEQWARSVAKSFERVGRLAHVLRMGSSPDDALVSAIQDELGEQGPLEQEIRHAVHSLVVSGRGQLDRTFTLFLLRDHLDKGLPIDDATAERLDDSTVIEFYTDDRRRILPSPESGSPLLPVQVRSKIWLKLISTEKSAAAIPGLLSSAYADLRPQVAEILCASINRSVALTNGLEMWIAHRRDGILGPLIRECLREESLRRALVEADNWPRDYLAFGLDSGGAGFARQDVPAQTVQTLVAEIARLSNSENALRQDARQWLCDLARSPLRLTLPIEDKLALRESISAGWENFHAMLELYWGNQAAAKAGGLSASEREVLIGELTELTTVRFRDDFVPNLRGLISFLGQLPDDAVSALASLRPKLSGNDIAGWMDGWEKLRPRDIYQDELIRQVMYSDKQFQIPTLLSKLHDEEKRTQLFKELFCGDSGLSDQEIFRRCERFIEYALAKDPTLGERSAAAFKACLTDQSRETVFFRRHCDSANFLDRLLEWLDADDRRRVVMIIFNLNYGRIENQACRYYTESQKKITFALTPYVQAVLWFALSPDGKPLRDAIVKNEELRNVSYVEKHLKGLLGAQAAREAQKVRPDNRPGDSAETEGPFKSLWRKIRGISS